MSMLGFLTICRRASQYQLSTSSVGYSSSPVHWSRWSPSILTWPQNEQASSAARPIQWTCTPEKVMSGG
ncbi:hypothetical protein TNCV_3865051 [Trichonephila clavipes]|nr:hypothetical protein TNCV_3865051 [Trichonephila clavipes]